jgi:hypothetical protein
LKSFLFYSLIGLALCISDAKAVEVSDLYLVKWPVAEQSKTARWKAALAGFKEVLVRKSGSRTILQSYQVQQAYSKVTSYLQSFEYTRQQVDGDGLPYMISLYYEPRLIDNLIKDSKMTLWGSSRPVTILWIAVEQGFKRRILKDETDNESPPNAKITNDNHKAENLAASIGKNAIRRGLPIISPLMDLEDELVVSISDVWGRFPSTILQASQRYSADSVLLGRLRKNGKLWRGEFTYINQLVQSSFDVSAKQPQQVIAQMMDKLAELLCDKYCVVEEMGQKNEILMNVSGISNFKKFKKAEGYLNKLSAIKQIDVVKINQHNVIFKLTLLGQIGSLIEGISLSQHLQLDEAAEALAIKLANQELELHGSDLNQPDLDEQATEYGDQSTDVLTPEPSDQSGVSETELLDNSALLKESQSENLNQDELKKLQTLYYRWLG